jgi:hypothetical protein
MYPEGNLKMTHSQTGAFVSSWLWPFWSKKRKINKEKLTKKI